MEKIIITGPPNSGKTTILDGLQNEALHSTYYVPEPATHVIQAEREKEAATSNYIGKFPWNNYAEFGELVIAKSLELEATIPENVEVVILDRSLIDTIGYARLNACDFLVPRVRQLVDEAGYSRALFCDFVGEYTSTDVRSESLEQARTTQRHLLAAYEEIGIPLVHIPPLGIFQRLQLVKEIVGR